MLIDRLTALAGIAMAAAAFATVPAEALTTKECSTKYQAAKDAGVLGDVKWNDFRKAECGPEASMEIKKPAKADDDAAKGLTSKQCSAKYQAAKEAGTLGDTKWNDFRKAECGPGASAEIEKTTKKKAAAKADDADAKGLTSKQCSAKYRAAKEAGTLGDMKWNDFRKAECGREPRLRSRRRRRRRLPPRRTMLPPRASPGSNVAPNIGRPRKRARSAT